MMMQEEGRRHVEGVPFCQETRLNGLALLCLFEVNPGTFLLSDKDGLQAPLFKADIVRSMTEEPFGIFSPSYYGFPTRVYS